jgi:hypothetical protein
VRPASFGVARFTVRTCSVLPLNSYVTSLEGDNRKQWTRLDADGLWAAMTRTGESDSNADSNRPERGRPLAKGAQPQERQPHRRSEVDEPRPVELAARGLSVGGGADLRHRANFDVHAGVAGHPGPQWAHPAAAALGDSGGLQVAVRQTPGAR